MPSSVRIHTHICKSKNAVSAHLVAAAALFVPGSQRRLLKVRQRLRRQLAY